MKQETPSTNSGDKLGALFFVTLIIFFLSSITVLDGHLERSSTSLRAARSLELVPERGAMMQYSPEAADEAQDESLSVKMLRAVSSEAENAFSGSAVSESLDKAMQEVNHTIPSNRMLAHNGQLSLMTKQGEVLTIANKIEEMVTEDGGYVESKNSYRDSYHFYNKNKNEQKSRLVMDLVLRIPSGKFHEIVAALQNLVGADMVQNLSINSRDVTGSFVDASSRAETLAASRKAMQVLLERANNVKEVMEVQRELNRLTQEYESTKSRANSLKKQSSLSTLSLNLMEQKEEGIPNDLDPGFSPSRTFTIAIKDVLSFFACMLEILVYTSVMVVAFVVPCLLCCELCDFFDKKKSFPALARVDMQWKSIVHDLILHNHNR